MEQIKGAASETYLLPHPRLLVPQEGFEPPTYRLQGDCTTPVLLRLVWLQGVESNHLSPGYEPSEIPFLYPAIDLVDPVGLEPTTYGLQSRRSPR